MFGFGLDYDVDTVASCCETEMITVSGQHFNAIRHLVWQISTAMATWERPANNSTNVIATRMAGNRPRRNVSEMGVWCSLSFSQGRFWWSEWPLNIRLVTYVPIKSSMWHRATYVHEHSLMKSLPFWMLHNVTELHRANLSTSVL